MHFPRKFQSPQRRNCTSDQRKFQGACFFLLLFFISSPNFSLPSTDFVRPLLLSLRVHPWSFLLLNYDRFPPSSSHTISSLNLSLAHEEPVVLCWYRPARSSWRHWSYWTQKANTRSRILRIGNFLWSYRTASSNRTAWVACSRGRFKLRRFTLHVFLRWHSNYSEDQLKVLQSCEILPQGVHLSGNFIFSVPSSQRQNIVRSKKVLNVQKRHRPSPSL